jgi:hypothetical protein
MPTAPRKSGPALSVSYFKMLHESNPHDKKKEYADLSKEAWPRTECILVFQDAA